LKAARSFSWFLSIYASIASNARDFSQNLALLTFGSAAAGVYAVVGEGRASRF